MRLLRDVLAALDACDIAVEWAWERTWPEAWYECPYASWLVWLAARLTSDPGWPTAAEMLRLMYDIILPDLDVLSSDEIIPAQMALEAHESCKGEDLVGVCRDAVAMSEARWNDDTGQWSEDEDRSLALDIVNSFVLVADDLAHERYLAAANTSGDLVIGIEPDEIRTKITPGDLPEVE